MFIKFHVQFGIFPQNGHFGHGTPSTQLSVTKIIKLLESIRVFLWWLLLWRFERDRLLLGSEKETTIKHANVQIFLCLLIQTAVMPNLDGWNCWKIIHIKRASQVEGSYGTGAGLGTTCYKTMCPEVSALGDICWTCTTLNNSEIALMKIRLSDFRCFRLSIQKGYRNEMIWKTWSLVKVSLLYLHFIFFAIRYYGDRQ